MGNLTKRWTKSEPFLKNQNTFSDFQRGQGRPHPSYAPVSVTEYASVFLNIPKYP